MNLGRVEPKSGIMTDLDSNNIRHRGLPRLENEGLPSRNASSAKSISSTPILKWISILSMVLVVSVSGYLLWRHQPKLSVFSTSIPTAPVTVESGRVQIKSAPQSLARAKRRAYVHIGPPKTGSTALQKALLNDYNRQMMKDGFFSPSFEDLPGTTFRGENKAHANLAACLYTNCDGPSSCHPLLLNETLPAFMERVKTTMIGNSVTGEEEFASLFLSAEGFASRCIDTRLLRELLADYHVTIVSLYRPQYERMVSIHSQRAKNAYPVLGLGFLDWINEPSTFEGLERQHSAFEEIYTSQLKEDGSSLFEEIIVLDYTEVMKQDAGLPAVMACDVLHARRTCKRIHKAAALEEDAEGINSFTNVNVFQEIDYRRIVEAGWAQDIVGTKSRTHIRDALTDFERLNAEQSETPDVTSEMARTVKSLKRYRDRKAVELQSWWEGNHGKSLLDLPHECVDDVILDQIKESSWKQYMRMIPYLLKTSQNDKDAMELTRDEMDQRVEAQHGKFCSVNVDAILLDPSWQDMLYT